MHSSNSDSRMDILRKKPAALHVQRHARGALWLRQQLDRSRHSPMECIAPAARSAFVRGDATRVSTTRRSRRRDAAMPPRPSTCTNGFHEHAAWHGHADEPDALRRRVGDSDRKSRSINGPDQTDHGAANQAHRRQRSFSQRVQVLPYELRRSDRLPTPSSTRISPCRSATSRVFVGSEVASNSRPPASASGFCTPPSGTLSGRLAISAMEGDATITGDTMLFGPTSSLGSGNRSWARTTTR